MPALYSNPPLADFVLSEAPGQRSRDNVKVNVAGTAIKSGTLLMLAAVGVATWAVETGSVGNPTIGTITVGAAALDGVYSLVFTSATAFKVLDPSGTQIGTGTAGTAFSAGGLGFTLTAGSTAAVAGSEININVTPGAKSYAVYDGSSPAVAVLYNQIPAMTGKANAVAFVIDCEVKRSALIGLTAAAETNLLTVGIKVRGKGGLATVSTPAL